MTDKAVILLAIISSVVAPAVLVGINWLVTRQSKYQDAEIKRRHQQEDWARQDAVALKAEEAVLAAQRTQEALVASAATQEKAQAEAIRRTEEVARIAIVNQAAIDRQLEQIHILVNSDYTAARRAVLEQARVTVLMIRKVIEMDEAAGRPPTKDDIASLKVADKFIADLEDELMERAHAAKTVEASIELGGQMIAEAANVAAVEANTVAVEANTAAISPTPPEGIPVTTEDTPPSN